MFESTRIVLEVGTAVWKMKSPVCYQAQIEARNTASVFPEPVGTEISVVCMGRIDGQPSCCGSVGVPKRRSGSFGVHCLTPHYILNVSGLAGGEGSFLPSHVTEGAGGVTAWR